MTTYRISQLAERAGLRPTALRFYEQTGLLPARRSSSGYRLYDDAALARLDFISAGKRLGLPLEEIRELLDVWEDGLCVDVRDRLSPVLRARVAEAEQRAAELDAFIGLLRRTLGAIDGPAPAGRCGPGCGLPHPEPHPEPDTAPVTAPATIGLGRPADQAAPAPIACSLTGGDQAERVRRWAELLAGATSRKTVDHGLRFRLPAELAGEVAALAAAEQRCCPFFDFTLRLAGGEVHVEVRAPDEAAPLLAEVFGSAA